MSVLISLIWRCASVEKSHSRPHAPSSEDLWVIAKKVGEWRGCLKTRRGFGNNRLAISRMPLTRLLVHGAWHVWEPVFPNSEEPGY